MDAGRIATDRFWNILPFDEIPSTNEYLKANCGSLPDGTVAVAARQTAGRGRRGRAFDSQGALCMSLLVKNAGQAPPLSLLCGLAVCEALGEDARLKWPNDVLLNGKKVCGILCEAVHTGVFASAVCGIGVNLAQSPSWFAARGLTGASSLKIETGGDPDFSDTAHRILLAAGRLLAKARRDPAAVVEGVRARCATLGKEVAVHRHEAYVRKH